MGKFLRPDTLDGALAALAGERWTVLAGGTDHYPARVVAPRHDENVMDISGLASLRGIADAGDHWRLGALTTWSEMAAAALPPCFDGLRAAAREVGGEQIQNRATIAGNLCNASPAADGVPPLLTLDGVVELARMGGTRQIPLDRFILGNRRTDRRDSELVTAIRVPKVAARARSAFLKLGARRYLVISIVMVAGLLEVDRAGRVTAARIAVGACAPMARRLLLLETELIGHPADAGLAAMVHSSHLAPLSAIDDARADAAYRYHAALVLVRRCLVQMTRDAGMRAA
ncbi:MAG: xanthine dehydrogenase family protein subunit M [Alphaproteobacteria bacterium]|nr:xanthine dehydrogenase family protein subunit M [Alphaproteobacteria bacterium]